MTLFKVAKVFTKPNLKAAIVVAVLSALVLPSSSGLAQTSPETATVLTRPSVSGSWSTNRVQKFYYSFTSTRGQLQVTLDTIGDSPGCQTVWVTILDKDRRDWRNDRQPYGHFFKLACRSRGTPVTHNFIIPERRPLLMRVSVEDNSGGTPYSGNYTITLGGTFKAKTTTNKSKLLREMKNNLKIKSPI